ncbi:MAG: signal peptide peptidase SppA [Polyangiaceae bacterium]
MKLRPITAFVGGTLFFASIPSASAQQPVQRPTPLPALGRSVAGTDDTTALVQNPANLAFLPGSEFRWSSIYLDESNQVPWQGHAFALGFPLPLIPVATGIRLDLVDPPYSAIRGPFGQFNYQWLTWGLGIGGEYAALGLSLQRTYSDASELDGLSSFTIGYSARPFDQVGLSLVAHDINSPTNALGLGLERSYDIALAVRPTGTRAVELGLEGKYIDRRSGYWIPRATLGIDLPYVGRLRGDFAMSRPDDTSRRAWTASANLAFHMNGPEASVEAAGGTVTGNGLGEKGSYGVQAEVAFRGFRETAGVEGRYALRIRIEETPSTRGHVALLERLWDIADEPAVDGVVLELRTAPATSLAHVQELRDAVQHLRAHGKRVLCHLEDAGGAELYLCSAANRTLMNPAGGLRFAGLKSQAMYFASLLGKLGIKADFVRIGQHKSAPERLTRDSATEVSRADKIDLLQQHERQFVEGVSQGRRIDVPVLRKRIAGGPYIASEALTAGFIDGYAFDDEVEAATEKLLGRPTALVDDDRAPRANKRFGVGRKVAIVYVDGDMVDGRSKSVPLVGMKLAGSYTIAKTLKQTRENPLIGAVVLRIESPGGSAMASDVIWREVQLTAKVKPVVVSMGASAASGGYYIASPASRVFANPLSITGSIGIFYGKADVSELLRKIGVSVETYKTAPRADAESIYRPFTADEKKELEKKVAQFYDVFLTRVAQGRKLDKKEVDKVGQGRVWTGEQALARKLVDELGGLRQALAYARQAGGLPDHAGIVELPPPDQSIIGKLLGLEGVGSRAGAEAILPGELVDVAKALAPFAVHAPDKPLARMELVPVKP